MVLVLAVQAWLAVTLAALLLLALVVVTQRVLRLVRTRRPRVRRLVDSRSAARKDLHTA